MTSTHVTELTEKQKRRQFQKQLRDAGWVRLEECAPAAVYMRGKSLIDIDQGYSTAQGVRPAWARHWYAGTMPVSVG